MVRPEGGLTTNDRCQMPRANLTMRVFAYGKNGRKPLQTDTPRTSNLQPPGEGVNEVREVAPDVGARRGA